MDSFLLKMYRKELGLLSGCEYKHFEILTSSVICPPNVTHVPDREKEIERKRGRECESELSSEFVYYYSDFVPLCDAVAHPHSYQRAYNR